MKIGDVPRIRSIETLTSLPRGSSTYSLRSYLKTPKLLMFLRKLSTESQGPKKHLTLDIFCTRYSGWVYGSLSSPQTVNA